MGTFCYILFNNVDTKHLGIIALSNAFIHAGVFILARSFSPEDKSAYYITLGLAIMFVTTAIPMELKSSWVILFWAMEALIIFYIGYRKKDMIFQTIAACIALLTIVLWSTTKFSSWYYPNETLPFWNISFFNNLITMVALSCIPILFQKQDSSIRKFNFPNAVLGWIIPISAILGGWYTFDREILNVFYYTNTESYDYPNLVRMLWIVFYALGIAWANKTFFRNEVLKQLAIISILIGVLICLTYGIEHLGNLRLLFVSGSGFWFYFILRYITIAYTGLAMYFYYQNDPWFTRKNKAVDTPMLLCYLVGLIWLSDEYFQWTSIGGYGLQSRFGLSIVWACYAVLLVAQGIRYKERYLRIAAIVLAGVTMLKLVFFDLINTTMLTKTIVFIALGTLLLVIAYLYNRHKDIIEGESNDGDEKKEMDKPTDME
jgi:hypothetical protein